MIYKSVKFKYFQPAICKHWDGQMSTDVGEIIDFF